MRLIPWALLLVACSGSHPSERPVIETCDDAFAGGRQGDECVLSGECGTVSVGDGVRRGAVCDDGRLLLSRIEETRRDTVGPCVGEWHAESDAFLALAPAELGCLDVTFCNEILGGGAALREARVCQLEPALVATPDATHGDCVQAVGRGQDADVCAGEFACIADRALAMGEVLPIFGWCDGGVLRLAPSQTLIHGG